MTQIQTELVELLEMVDNARLSIIELEPMRAQARIELDSKEGLSDLTGDMYHSKLTEISDKLFGGFRQTELIHILSLQQSTPGWPASVETQEVEGQESPIQLGGGGGKTHWPP